MEQIIKPRLGVVIVAGGRGVRMGGGQTPKQFRILSQLPVLAHSINLFREVDSASDIVVCLPGEYIEYWENLSARFKVAKHRAIEGGKERFESVKKGIEALGEGVEVIAVHDGVRPLCSVELVERAISTAVANGSAVPVVEAVDSFRRVSSEGSYAEDRSTLRAVQTPQIFDAILLRRAYKQEYSPLFTDDASVVESLGERVELCEGERTNIKITTHEDLIYATSLLDAWEEAKAQAWEEMKNGEQDNI